MIQALISLSFYGKFNVETKLERSSARKVINMNIYLTYKTHIYTLHTNM